MFIFKFCIIYSQKTFLILSHGVYPPIELRMISWICMLLSPMLVGEEWTISAETQELVALVFEL